MRWTWNPRKAEENLRKHKVSFELAKRVFRDPFAITVPDPYPYEQRWQTIGIPGMARPIVLLVVHTWSEDEDDEQEGRIISARLAETHERRRYADGQS